MARRLVKTDFKSVDPAIDWRLEIWDLAVNSADLDYAVEMNLPGFEIQWVGDEASSLDPFLSSSCSFTLSLTEQQRGAIMSRVYGSSEFSLAVRVVKVNVNASTSSVYWVGQLHPEETTEVVEDGYITVDFKASDGLAQLDFIDFKETNGEAYEGKYSAASYIHKILLKTPTLALWYDDATVGSLFMSEHFLNRPVIQDDSFSFSHTGSDGTTRGVLDYLHIDPITWYIKNQDTGIIGDEFLRYPTTKKDGFVSCKTVLQDILSSLGATICFSEGSWKIFDRCYLDSTTTSLSSAQVITYNRKQDGTLEASLTNTSIDVDLDSGSSEFRRGVVRRGMHPLGGASQVHKNSGSDLMFGSGVGYSFQGLPVYRFESSEGTFPSSDADDPSGIHNFAGVSPASSSMTYEGLAIPNGNNDGLIRLHLAGNCDYTLIGNFYGTLGILSFKFQLTDYDGVDYRLKRRVRTLASYSNGTAFGVDVNNSANDYYPKFYESDYYEWVASTDSGYSEAQVDLMLGADPTLLTDGVGTTEQFLTEDFPSISFHTPPGTQLDPDSNLDNQLLADTDVSKRKFVWRFDQEISTPTASNTIVGCTMHSMWLTEWRPNAGPDLLYAPGTGTLLSLGTDQSGPSYRTESVNGANDGIYLFSFYEKPLSINLFQLSGIELFNGDGTTDFDNRTVFTPSVEFGSEIYSLKSTSIGGAFQNTGEYTQGRYEVSSFSDPDNREDNFKMTTAWDNTDVVNRMSERTTKNLMQIREKTRQVVEGSLFSYTEGSSIVEPWQRVVTSKLSGSSEIFIPHRCSLVFGELEQKLSMLKVRGSSSTITGSHESYDQGKGGRPATGGSKPNTDVAAVFGKTLEVSGDLVSLESDVGVIDTTVDAILVKTNNITITQPVNLDSIETNLNSLYSNFKQGASTDVYAGADLTTHLELTGTTANLKVNTTGLEITETSPGDIEFVVATDASGATPFTAVHLDGLTTGSSADFLIKQGTNLKVYGSTGYAWLRHTGGSVQVGLPGSSGTLALQSEVYTDADADARIALASIDDLVDVDATGVSDGDALAYNATSGNWEPTNSTGGNHAFHRIVVSGQSTVEADNANDVLTLVAGSNLAITTDANTDTITFTPSLTPTFTSVTAGILSTSVGIVNSGTLSAGNTTINGTLTSGAISSNSTISCSALSFAGSGTSTIAPVGSGAAFPDDLELRSNGNITLVLDYDSDEAAQAFIVKNQAGTVIFQVDEDGFSSGLFTSDTPTIATVSNFESTQTGTVTVNNYDSHATYLVKLFNSSGTEQTSQTITDNSDGTWSITNGAILTGAYIEVQALEFGKLVSATATSNSFNITAAATQQRYWRLQMTDASKNPVNAMVALGDFRLYTATGGGGTAYPSNMTSETTPTPYVVTKGYEYGTYSAWKAMDGSGSSANSMWWTLSNSVAADNWIQIDLGSSIDFPSGECQITTTGGWTSANYAVLYGSNTGDFTGEEREMAFFQNIDKAGEAGGTFTTYTQAIT